MRVTHRMLAHAVNRNLKNNMYALNRRSNQLATGKIFDRPSQDPIGAYKVMRIAGTGLARNEQYQRNIGEGISWLSATENALASSIDALQRLREISVYTANEVFSPADRLAVAPEVKELLNYLISIGNTELAGLYIFGGHQTDQKPYVIAGDNGAVINTWHNAYSGLDRTVGAGTGIVLENLATGNYAVSTVASEELTKVNPDIIDEINLNNLENYPEGHYKILTHANLTEAISTASVAEYRQVGSGEAVTAEAVAGNEHNISLLMEVTGISGNEITFTYQLEAMDKNGNEISSVIDGTITLEAGGNRAAEINTLIFGGDDVFSDFTLPDVETFSSGDKIAVNVTAAADEDDHGVDFYRDGQVLGSFVFNNGALDGEAVNFKFFELDTNPGSFTHGDYFPFDMELTFEALAETGLDNPAASFQVGPTVTIASEYLQGARDGFFGTDKISISLDSAGEFTGSVALEIMEEIRVKEGDADDVNKKDDRIIRLSVRYLMKDMEGINHEGTYGFREGEDIYLNLNRLSEGGQQISFDVDGQEIKLNIAGREALTYEHNIPLVGDKLVLQVNARAPFTSGDDYDRFTLHRDYGSLDENSRPTTGDALSWYFKSDASVFDDKTTVLKYFDIDPTSGNFFTSTLKAKFDNFNTAAAVEYRDREDILSFGVPDEEYGSYPAAIFSFIASGEPYFRGDNGARLLEIAPGIDVPANISGLNAFDHQGKDGVDLFRVVHDLYQALIHNDQVALGGRVLEGLDRNLENILKNRSEVGARMERFLVTEDRHQSEHIFLRELRTKVEDIDMAEVITEFTLQESAYQAALATGARIIYPSLIDFLR